MEIDTERALRMAHEEMRRRHRWAAEEHLAREARRAAAEARADAPAPPADGGALAWLRRLVGAR